MRILFPIVVAAFLVSPAPTRAAEPAAPVYADRWVYCQCNLQVEKQADELVELIYRAAMAGYTSIVLADYKLNVLDRVPGLTGLLAVRQQSCGVSANWSINGFQRA